MLLEGKNIVLTGAGRGIGKHVAIAYGKEGANLGLIARTESELNDTKKEIENLGTGVRVILQFADVTKYEEMEQAFKVFSEELGLINGVVANAGTSRMGTSHEFDSKTFDNILKVNVLGVFNTFKAAYPYLKKDDKKDKARFLITGSAAYISSMPKFAAYTASKYATVGLQKALALEYKKENITFNQILPTMVDTRLLRGKRAGDGNKPDNVMNPWDLNDYYVFIMTEKANKVNDQLIVTSDFEEIKKILKETPSENKKDWNTFKEVLQVKAPKILENVRKLGKLVEYLMLKEN
ncbi:MAG: SDR family NAD(P)-dependent oxidoreductase [Promethearchaeota archaeon]